MIALSVALGAAPSLFLLVFFYLKDRYEPEPRGHVALAFAKGALAILPAYFAARGLELVVGKVWLAIGGLPAKLFEAVILAGTVEELAKWLVFVLLIYRWSEFDEPLDGVVYGVALALGFATVENILCVVRDGLAIGVLRAVFAVPAHALFGAAMGFYMGAAKLGSPRRSEKALRLALALAVPILFHSLYDFALVELHGAWLYAVVGVLSVALWAFVLRRVHRAQRQSPFRKVGDEVH
ncbi:MAG TPA: PrsW family glutamic-type intramembrane protease [Kofleriaceae bacterium]|nr:PrsW family glutamic-type intramembrane protease [Kofleriaceae bacterium]